MSGDLGQRTFARFHSARSEREVNSKPPANPQFRSVPQLRRHSGGGSGCCPAAQGCTLKQSTARKGRPLGVVSRKTKRRSGLGSFRRSLSNADAESKEKQPFRCSEASVYAALPAKLPRRTSQASNSRLRALRDQVAWVDLAFPRSQVLGEVLEA